MTVLEIPLTPGPQTFLVTLSGHSYRFTITYRECLAPDEIGGWVLDIGDGDAGPLVNGIPLLPGSDLLEQYRHLGFAGSMLLLNEGAPDEAPAFGDLGSTSRLYYVTDNDPAV